MSTVLLHWTHNGVTYSIRQEGVRGGWLYASSPNGEQRRGRQRMSLPIIEAWASMSDDQRSKLAELLLPPAN